MTDRKNTIIESKNIYINELNLTNYSPEYHHWLNDPNVNRYLESRFKRYTNDDIKKYIKQMLQSDNNYLFGIFIKSSNEHIGNIKIGEINHYHKFADIGLLIGNVNYWGKGFGTESIYCASIYAFDVIKLNKLTAGMYENNFGSYKSFVKMGFREVGRYFNHCFFDTDYVDKYILELLKKNFEKIEKDNN